MWVSSDEMSDSDAKLHISATYSQYCINEFKGEFIEIEKINPALIGIQNKRILSQYSAEVIGTLDIQLAKSFISKTAEQKRALCINLDQAMALMNEEVSRISGQAKDVY